MPVEWTDARTALPAPNAGLASRTQRDRPGPGYVWTCTRIAGHDGPHVAHHPRGDVMAAWWHSAEPVTVFGTWNKS